MKSGTHPEYQKVAFHDTAADKYFVVGSTMKSNRTVELDGETLPYVALDTSSASHPFYTGKQRIAKQDGRIARFENRYGKKS